MYIYVYICMYVYIYVSIYAYIYIYIHIYQGCRVWCVREPEGRDVGLEGLRVEGVHAGVDCRHPEGEVPCFASGG